MLNFRNFFGEKKETSERIPVDIDKLFDSLKEIEKHIIFFLLYNKDLEYFNRQCIKFKVDKSKIEGILASLSRREKKKLFKKLDIRNTERNYRSLLLETVDNPSFGDLGTLDIDIGDIDFDV